MRSTLILPFIICFISLSACGLESEQKQSASDAKEIISKPGADVEKLWMDYAQSKGGLTWAESATYPEYEKVSEGDTFLIQLEQGPCLMEFFHSRWRRANDVRRWDDAINTYGGCPYVFE